MDKPESGGRRAGYSPPAVPAAVDALKASEASYRGLFNTIRQAIYIQSPDGRFVDVNDGAVAMYGYNREELIGKDPGFVAAPGLNDVEALRQHLERAFAGEPQQFEFWGRRKNGEVFPKDVRVYKGTYFGRDVLIAVAADITERKRAEAALRESEARYRVLFEAISDAVFVNDIGDGNMAGRFLQVNAEACRRLGYTREELLQLTPAAITAPEAWAANEGKRRELLATGATMIESVQVAHDGRRFPVESNVHLLQYAGRQAALSISRDLTERKRAEEHRLELERRILHVQKLESLGVLAGGIAHDFNNILVAVLGYADLALADLPAHSPARESVTGIEVAARRAADLCRQMLAYSGRGRFVVEPVDLSELVAGIAPLARASVSRRATFTMDLPAGLPAIEVDVTQVRQVVMNLVTNASEALDDRGGTVTVTTSARRWTKGELETLTLSESPADGEFVCLEVSDTGCGMNAETLDRIFDPFFSTKFVGRGLGMPAVLGIVRGHKGAIDIRTQVGAGTTFRVLFPATARQAAPLPAAGAAQGRGAWQGSGCVLVVDDEESVRAIARRMLERAGFEVLEAADGREGLAVFRANRARIRLVLLDLTMPGMDGLSTFQELRADDPDVRVLMSSGFSEPEIAARTAGSGLAGFVEKPYARADLIDRVRAALESPGDGGATS